MGLGRPVSRILLYPAIHLRGVPGPLWERLRLPARNASRRQGQFGLLAPVVCLAGPSRDTAGGLLPHPFTHHLCRREAPRPSAGLLSVALDVTEGLRLHGFRRPRPSGYWPERPLLRVRTLLYAPGRSRRAQRQVGRPEPYQIIPYGLKARLGAPYGAAAADEHDPGRGQAQLDPLGAVPALAPARVVADLGVEPDARARRLEHPLVRGVVLRVVQYGPCVTPVDGVAGTEGLHRRG